MLINRDAACTRSNMHIYYIIIFPIQLDVSLGKYKINWVNCVTMTDKNMTIKYFLIKN